MRLSVDKDDPGYHPAAVGSRVWFDGVEITHVITADEEKRLVVVHQLDDGGRLMLNTARTEVLRATRFGHVRIEPSECLRLSR